MNNAFEKFTPIKGVKSPGWGWVGPTAAAVTALIVFNCSFEIVDPGHRGVAINLGTVNPHFRGEGWNWKWPWGATQGGAGIILPTK